MISGIAMLVAIESALLAQPVVDRNCLAWAASIPAVAGEVRLLSSQDGAYVCILTTQDRKISICYKLLDEDDKKTGTIEESVDDLEGNPAISTDETTIRAITVEREVKTANGKDLVVDLYGVQYTLKDGVKESVHVVISVRRPDTPEQKVFDYVVKVK